jgi:flavin reductase (DIM6/NTAB) family NADH-FMN oxidoreductase RutF
MKPVEDPHEFREALGAFATGVTVITALGSRGEPVGFTANSFNSVSLEPPLVLFSLDKQASVLSTFLSTRHFAVNVLREDQRSLSEHFANFKGDRWKDLEYETWETGCPILADALASFECDYRYTYDGGDHVIFVGEVKRMDPRGAGRPLLYFGGAYHRLDPDSGDSDA